MRGLLAAIALAACSGDTLVIEVIVPEGMDADQIELFIADGDCAVDTDGDGEADVCMSITPDTGFRRGGDQIFFTDKDGVPPTPASGAGTYVFRLERGKHDDDIPVMIALASANGEATGVAVLKEWAFSDGPLRLQVHLDKTSQFFGDTDPDTRTVHVWRHDAATCVGAERGPDDIVFLVSREDPDCDGYIDRDAPAPNTECDPLAWEGRVVQSPFTFTCAAKNDRGECLLGENACTDGVGLEACAPTEQCVAIENCSNCETSTDIAACLDQTRQLATMARIACDVRGEPVGDGSLQTCDPISNQADVGVDLDLEIFVGTSKCSDVAFAPPDDPQTYDLGRYLQGRLEIQTTDRGDPNGIMRFDVQNLTENCKFTLRWQGPSPATTTVNVAYNSTIAIRVKEATHPRIIMLPLALAFGGCQGLTEAGSCLVAGELTSLNSIRQCAD